MPILGTYTTGSWVSGPNPGALTEPVDRALPEAPAEHPLVAPRYPATTYAPDQVIHEEACDWFRSLTDEECPKGYTHAVGIDFNMAFAAAKRLVIGTGPETHVKNPAFEPKLPDSWLVGLSHIETDPRLLIPFTPRGPGRPGLPGRRHRPSLTRWHLATT